jgi:hypothetical protein
VLGAIEVYVPRSDALVYRRRPGVPLDTQILLLVLIHISIQCESLVYGDRAGARSRHSGALDHLSDE